MFRVLSIIIILLSLWWLFKFWSKNKLPFSKVISNYFSLLKKSFKDIGLLKSNCTSFKLQWLKNFFYLTTLFLFLLMFLSAFIAVLFKGDNLGGVLLLVHVFIAPIFSIFLAILIVLVAHSNRLNKHDIIDFNNAPTKKTKFRFTKTGYLKLSFWLITFFSLPTILFIILSMFPIYGTEGQIVLFNLHRYSALILLVLVVIHSGILAVESKK